MLVFDPESATDESEYPIRVADSSRFEERYDDVAPLGRGGFSFVRFARRSRDGTTVRVYFSSE
jgi:hypothetical protein